MLLSGTAITGNHQQAGVETTNAAGMSEAGVRKVDMDANKITLRHGPIANPGMPPMTMVFQVGDSAMLTQVKPGDKVRFSADKSGGAYVITVIQLKNQADSRKIHRKSAEKHTLTTPKTR